MVDASPTYPLFGLRRALGQLSSSSQQQTKGQLHPSPIAQAIIIISLLLAVSPQAFAIKACVDPDYADQQAALELDWAPISQLTEAQRTTLSTGCCGAYVTPLRDDEDALADPASSRLRATADTSDAHFQSDIVMHGNVQITQGYRSIRADTATYNQATRQVEISGDIQLREPGLLLRAERARVDIDHGNATLDDAQFVLHETRIRGSAERLEKFGDRLYQMENSRFTSCEPGSDLWSVGGSDIRIYPNDHYGTARHMRLNVFDVPVFYAPYVRFPVGNERLTGFLYPSISLDRRVGVDEIEVPFYWNLAPNYDLTLIPRYMRVHGGILDAEFRHLSRLFETQMDVSYLANDQGNYHRRDLELIAEGRKTDYTDEQRWLYQLEQSGGFGQRWSSYIDYTDISDTDYLRDINGSALDDNRQAFVKKFGSVDYRTDHWLLGVRAQEFRLLTERQLPYRQLPSLQANGTYRWHDWQLDLGNEYTNFDINSYYTASTTNLIVGERLRTASYLTWDKEFIWGFFKPSMAYKTLSYHLDTAALTATSDDSPRLHTPQASLDTGLYFEREQRYFNTGFTQTLEPRLFFLYSDYEDHSPLYRLTANNRNINFDTAVLTFSYNQLYRDTRFAGGDRLDDANQITVGVSSAWIEDATGVERLRMSLGQILYFDERRVAMRELTAEELQAQQDTSPIAAQATGQLSPAVRWQSDIAYDHRSEKVETGSISMRYMDDRYRIFNLGYRYTRNPSAVSPSNPELASGKQLNQLDASVIWPVANQWSVIARSNYDFYYKLELDSFAGLEYNDCCYRIRIVARRWLNFDYTADFLERASSDDYRDGIFLDIQLKGLGSLSDRIGRLLDKAVIGYDQREKNIR